MIVVTGATGKLGHAIVESLLRRIDASEIGISVRDPSKAADLAARGVRVRRGDFADGDTLRMAFEGASQLLMISSNASATGGDPVAQHRTAIDAGHAAGVQRIVYTSQIAASPTSLFAPALTHASTEAMLATCGIPFTSLRNGFYATSAVGFVKAMIESGQSVAPQDGPISWTTHADLAEAAAAILTQPPRFEGPTPPLTGSEALDLADLAALASELTGRKIERFLISDEAARAKMIERGTPAHIVEISMGMTLASRRGEFARVDPTMETLLGREPIAIRDVIAAAIG